MANINNQIDQLTYKIYESLDLLVESSKESELVDTNILDLINNELLKFKDLIRIFQNYSINDGKYSYNLQLYQLKYKILTEKFRNIQLYIYDLQQEKLTQLRIEKYGLNKTKESATPNDKDIRDELFSNRSTKKLQELSVNQQITKQNKQITASLQTSRQLLEGSILQSELNLDSIDQQAKDLFKLNENFIKFNDLLMKSKNIIKFIEKQDKSDRKRIYMAMGFFILCCCWVIYRRILRRPLRILFWSLFKIFNIFNWIFGPSKIKIDQNVVPMVTIDTLDATTTLKSLSETSTLMDTLVETATNIVIHDEL
ncbi:unnamed protein product [Candida verbasci]|uniref:Sec20 C-terminal domain-containing protein n=1 Tax=Candida verbasci TaxID=1227364 RepID=A0A9W4TY31_9ASCO|nr:unnamed protein product [Candida verbasci]